MRDTSVVPHRVSALVGKACGGNPQMEADSLTQMADIFRKSVEMQALLLKYSHRPDYQQILRAVGYAHMRLLAQAKEVVAQSEKPVVRPFVMRFAN